METKQRVISETTLWWKSLNKGEKQSIWIITVRHLMTLPQEEQNKIHPVIKLHAWLLGERYIRVIAYNLFHQSIH